MPLAGRAARAANDPRVVSTTSGMTCCGIRSDRGVLTGWQPTQTDGSRPGPVDNYMSYRPAGPMSARRARGALAAVGAVSAAAAPGASATARPLPPALLARALVRVAGRVRDRSDRRAATRPPPRPCPGLRGAL